MLRCVGLAGLQEGSQADHIDQYGGLTASLPGKGIWDTLFFLKWHRTFVCISNSFLQTPKNFAERLGLWPAGEHIIIALAARERALKIAREQPCTPVQVPLPLPHAQRNSEIAFRRC